MAPVVLIAGEVAVAAPPADADAWESSEIVLPLTAALMMSESVTLAVAFPESVTVNCGL